VKSKTALDEFELIDAIAAIAAIAEPASADRAAAGVRIGIGDDAAVVALDAPAVLTTDTLTEGVHFRSDWLTARDLGRRAVRVAASDVAAMGGRVRFVLLSLGVPTGLGMKRARELVRGVVEEATGAGGALVGGNVSNASELLLTVTVVGEAIVDPVRRDGACVGDRIFVTGSLGAAAAGVEQLYGGRRRGALVDAWRRPPQRRDVGEALARAGIPTAMIDVSDGLVQDLAHVCRSSRLSAVIDRKALPLSPAVGRSRSLRSNPLVYALSGGEDYELVFTAAGKNTAARARQICARHECPLTVIGEMVDGESRGPVIDENGEAVTAPGYRHGRVAKR